MKKCPYCRKLIYDDTKICSHCFKSIKLLPARRVVLVLALVFVSIIFLSIKKYGYYYSDIGYTVKYNLERLGGEIREGLYVLREYKERVCGFFGMEN